MHDRVIQGVLDPTGAAVRAQVKVALRLLWGNAASSLAGTVLQLAHGRPRHADAALDLGEALMRRSPLAGLGAFSRPDAGTPSFTRSTCCLYYRIPGCAKCGDCALAPTARSRPSSAH